MNTEEEWRTEMGVNDVSLSASALGEASSGLAEVAAEFADELGGAPTLAEFLDIIGSALPTNSAATDGTFSEPLRLIKGGPHRKQAVPKRCGVPRP
jgi:hypothetical protein